MDRKNKGGIYITACCLAVIAAVIGFSGKRAEKEKGQEPIAEVIPQTEIAQSNEAPQEEKKESRALEEETTSVSKATIVEEVRFIRPVDGKVLEEFSENNLIYNDALRDWRTHDGIDLEAEQGAQVVASANGIIESVSDSNMGTCVLIDHQNGYKTFYANLDESTAVKKGDEVSEGDVIGVVGNTALGDATDLPHLHFEITKDGENVNPKEYME